MMKAVKNKHTRSECHTVDACKIEVDPGLAQDQDLSESVTNGRDVNRNKQNMCPQPVPVTRG